MNKLEERVMALIEILDVVKNEEKLQEIKRSNPHLSIDEILLIESSEDGKERKRRS